MTGASASTSYTLTVYPTQGMFDQFSTKSPLAVALGLIGVIAICTSIFFIYDTLMRHESRHRKMILEMKRRFIRFLSHEIRCVAMLVDCSVVVCCQLNRFVSPGHR